MPSVLQWCSVPSAHTADRLVCVGCKRTYSKSGFHKHLHKCLPAVELLPTHLQARYNDGSDHAVTEAGSSGGWDSGGEEDLPECSLEVPGSQARDSPVPSPMLTPRGEQEAGLPALWKNTCDELQVDSGP